MSLGRSFAPKAGVARADLALAALVVAIVAMMVVPLPTPLIDLLIALNLTLGILLLSAALYVREPLSLAAFPTLLLLSTLYRLALNVSSTRLILLQADAGRVIEAFGTFVVRGDYLVGAMVFLILTLIQFIVIARGAERVAEVGARFSLDAMPGKQLAIDAEQRAGNISPEAARVLRRELERESQLYGALDGAMKFVKGDAIAGIVITLVNFVGGVAIGVGSRGLDLRQSLTTYGLLTIGDGLVTQIPALLGATAAGLLVTRVASDERDGSLARDVARQLLGDRRALAVGASVLLVLALVPGLPAWPFAFAAGLCALGLVRGPTTPAEELAPASVVPSQAREPLCLELGAALAERLAPRGRVASELSRALNEARDQLARSLGLGLPEPRVRHAPTLAPTHFRWKWRELPELATEASQADAPAAIAASLQRLARRRAADCLGFEEVQRMLEALEREQPALVRHTVPRPVSPQLLAQVLRRLVSEGVSVRWLPEILEALAHTATHETRSEALAEHTRRALARRISSALAPDGRLHLLRLSPEVEEALADALKRDGQGEWLALSPDLALDITRAVSDSVLRAPEPRALLTQAPLRRHVRALLEHSSPELAVVSPHELSPELALTHAPPIGP